MRLDGKRVIITGGASGMGRGLVLAFPAIGVGVVSLDRAAEAGKDVAASAGAQFVECDVSSEQSVRDAFDAALEVLGGLDVLIHAAGIAPGARAADTSRELWDDILNVNATGTFLTNLAAFAAMKDHGGRIINFASAAGVQGYPGKPGYAASKGAVVAWVRSVAVEWAPYNITVNAVAPAIRTPMYETTRASMTAEQLKAHDELLQTAIPLGGRLGDVDRDLVPVLTFLSGDGAGFVTGQVLPVDGGALMMR